MNRQRLNRFMLLASVACCGPFFSSPVQANGDEKLRIICFGAHPDDAEYKAGGVAAKWAAMGHHVKFVSVTNGDIGHWQIAGGPLAQRRTAEVKQAAKVLGIESEVLDIHDGELLPTLENRRTITRLIRTWKADVVMSHRPNDYHLDHRYTGVLVQDAAFMVTVPFFCPDTPPLTSNPAFFYYSDGFQKPNPFTADVIVAIDDVMDKKIEAVHSLPSQAYEGGASGSEAFVTAIPGDAAGRKAWALEHHGSRYAAVADRFRDALVKWYGPARQGGQVCRGLRDLRIRSQAERRRVKKAVSVLRALVGRSADDLVALALLGRLLHPRFRMGHSTPATTRRTTARSHCMASPRRPARSLRIVTTARQHRRPLRPPLAPYRTA